MVRFGSGRGVRRFRLGQRRLWVWEKSSGSADWTAQRAIDDDARESKAGNTLIHKLEADATSTRPGSQSRRRCHRMGIPGTSELFATLYCSCLSYSTSLLKPRPPISRTPPNNQAQPLTPPLLSLSLFPRSSRSTTKEVPPTTTGSGETSGLNIDEALIESNWDSVTDK